MITANVESVDRNALFQEQLNKFPAFFHLDGDKRIVGYFTFFALQIMYMAIGVYGFYELSVSCSARDVFIFAVLLLIFYGPVIIIRFYLLKNRYNTFLFIFYGIELLIIFVSMHSSRERMEYLMLSDILMIVCGFVMTGWIVLAVFIRGKAMAIACRVYNYEVNNEIDLARIRLFDTDDRKGSGTSGEASGDGVVSDDPVFLDEEPNWNSKVVLRKPTSFCTKCGFGLVEGEDVCHVCGMKVGCDVIGDEDAEGL